MNVVFDGRLARRTTEHSVSHTSLHVWNHPKVRSIVKPHNHSLAAYDPFADTGDNNELQVQGYIRNLSSFIHSLDIRIQQRNGRKTLTTVQGLPADLDQKRILKAFKKEFACNGTVIEDEELGEVIQLQGDQRLKVQQFLIAQEIVTKDKVKIHGF
jgi:translation initiation factor 1